MALFIDVVLLRYKPQFTWPGLIVVLLGIRYITRGRKAQAQGANRRSSQGESKRMANLLATKPLNLLMEEARETGEHSLKRTLGVFN